MGNEKQGSTEPDLQTLAKTDEEQKTPPVAVERVNQLWYEERDPYLA